MDKLFKVGPLNTTFTYGSCDTGNVGQHYETQTVD